VYLLNNRYTPFYKWMAYGVQQLPKLGQAVGLLLRELAAFPASGMQEEAYYVHKFELMQQICGILVTELQRQGLSDSNDPFLVEQGMAVHRTIGHEGLRGSNPWSDQ
jgi:hypothetical protein